MPARFTPEQMAEAAAGLSEWTVDGDSLVRTLKFPDHITAMGFVVRAAMAAEVMDHHPDLRIVYNTVHLRLSSHDAGGVTERDVRLARKINEIT